jgi:hypothetical protein
VNQHTHSLSQDQPSWDISAVVLASSTSQS